MLQLLYPPVRSVRRKHCNASSAKRLLIARRVTGRFETGAPLARPPNGPRPSKSAWISRKFSRAGCVPAVLGWTYSRTFRSSQPKWVRTANLRTNDFF